MPPINIEFSQKAKKIAKMIEQRDPKQIYIMRMRESPRSDMKISFVNKKYLSK